MAQPPFLAAGVAGSGTFASTCAVLLDLGDADDIGLAVQAWIDAGASGVHVAGITVGGTMVGGTTVGSGAGSTNVNGTITGGIALTLLPEVAGGAFLSTAGQARAAYIDPSIAQVPNGLQWVQMRCVNEAEPPVADSNGKPTLVVLAYGDVATVATSGGSNGGFVLLSTNPAIAGDADANGVFAALAIANISDAYTAVATAPTVQHIRGLAANAGGYNSFAWAEGGPGSQVSLDLSITGAFTPGLAGTKFIFQGAVTPTVVSGTPTAADGVAAGTIGAAGPSGVSGAVTGDEGVAAGTISPGASSTVTTKPFARNPGLGGLLPNLNNVAIALLVDDSGLARLAGSPALSTGSDARLTFANGAPVPAGTKVIVVTRETGVDGALGVERYVTT